MTIHDPLVRRVLPVGTIDLCVGESHLVRQALRDTFTPPSTFDLLDVTNNCDYQEPEGYPPLVQSLERRHGQHVVITAGAKQGLAACFYAAKRMGMDGLTMRTPYWSQMPHAAKIMGLMPHFTDAPINNCAHLIVSPNNPDGHVMSLADAAVLKEQCRQLGVPLIHDAAYHTPVYLNEMTCADPLPDLADITIYSVAKMYGMSGLRIGWVTCKDLDFKQHVCDYVETTTVGVSVLSQRTAHRIIQLEETVPGLRELFTHRAQQLLIEAKKVAAKLDPDVLDATGVEQSIGMFGWFKVGPRFDNEIARIAVAHGEHFGDETRVRLNLAVEPHLLYEAISRLNRL